LYPELVKLGHEVHLITVEFGEAPLYEVVEGVRVHRVPVALVTTFPLGGEPKRKHGLSWGKLMLEDGPFDVIHAHDWLVGDAAIAQAQLPLISTIHATNTVAITASTPPHRITSAAKKSCWLITLGGLLLQRLCAGSGMGITSPGDKIDVIYNGIRLEKKQLTTTLMLATSAASLPC